MVPPGFDPSGLLCDVMDIQAAGCCIPGATQLRQQQSRTRVASNALRESRCAAWRTDSCNGGLLAFIAETARRLYPRIVKTT